MRPPPAPPACARTRCRARRSLFVCESRWCAEPQQSWVASLRGRSGKSTTICFWGYKHWVGLAAVFYLLLVVNTQFLLSGQMFPVKAPLLHPYPQQHASHIHSPISTGCLEFWRIPVVTAPSLCGMERTSNPAKLHTVSHSMTGNRAGFYRLRIKSTNNRTTRKNVDMLKWIIMIVKRTDSKVFYDVMWFDVML